MDTILRTWADTSEFCFEGSVLEGTLIHFGKTGHRLVTRTQYASLLQHFHGTTVDIGTSRTSPPKGSLGEWLQQNVTRTAIASYVGPILVHSQYAERVPGAPTKIRIVNTLS